MSVGALIFFAIVGAFICARVRVAGGAVVFPLVAPKARQRSRCGEREAAGRVLLAAGRPVREVARRCGVSERTAAHWAARLRGANRPAMAEGSSGGHRAPLLISHTHNPQPGT